MRRLVKWLAYTILVLVFLIAIFGFLLPTVFASKLAVISSGSMGAAMPEGALAVLEEVDPAAIEVGDIIAFKYTPDTTVSHRVIEVLEGETRSFRTQGDANKDADPGEVPAADVIGRVRFNIPHLGYIVERIGDYTRGQLGFVLFICLPGIVLIGSAARDLNFMLSPGKKMARRRKKVMERRKKRKFRL